MVSRLRCWTENRIQRDLETFSKAKDFGELESAQLSKASKLPTDIRSVFEELVSSLVTGPDVAVDGDRLEEEKQLIQATPALSRLLESTRYYDRNFSKEHEWLGSILHSVSPRNSR